MPLAIVIDKCVNRANVGKCGNIRGTTTLWSVQMQGWLQKYSTRILLIPKLVSRTFTVIFMAFAFKDNLI